MNGYQVRTERTKAQLLEAAQEVFARDGFEGAQLETIAKAAGRSKGAIYTHYRSKDDLFLALCEHRTRIEAEKIFNRVRQCKDRREAVEALKSGLIEASKNRTWMLLSIEAKLYALRHPELRERWLKANHEMFRSKNTPFDRQMAETLLYGKLTTSQRANVEARFSALSPVLAGLTLEAEFEPKLSTKRLRAVLNELFDVLLKPV